MADVLGITWNFKDCTAALNKLNGDFDRAHLTALRKAAQAVAALGVDAGKTALDVRRAWVGGAPGLAGRQSRKAGSCQHVAARQWHGAAVLLAPRRARWQSGPRPIELREKRSS